MTTGRQMAYISASPSAFIVTSGPMPAASPIVIPTTGPATSCVSFQSIECVQQGAFGAESAGLSDCEQLHRGVADQASERHTRLDLRQQVDTAHAEMAAHRARRVAAGKDEPAQAVRPSGGGRAAPQCAAQ